MANVKNENAPWLGGWIIGAGMGAAALAVSKVLFGFDWTPAVAIGGVIAGLAGAIMGMPWGAGDKAKAAAALAAAQADKVADAAHPVAKAPSPPMAEASVTPAAFVQTAPIKTPAAAEAPVAAPAAAPKAEKAAAAGPVRLKAPRNGKADDLKEIEGIGPAMEKLINEMGFYHFDQIASWSDADVALIDGEMKSFKGRITRDKWVAQAKIIVTEGLEAFRIRAKTNNY